MGIQLCKCHDESFDENRIHKTDIQNLENLSSSEKIEEIYEFIEEIGDGSFGKVFKACLRQDPTKIVAIKKIDKEKMAKAHDFLIEEVKILNKLDHPNIVRFHEVYNDEKFLYIVQEYCSGGDLFARIK